MKKLITAISFLVLVVGQATAGSTNSKEAQQQVNEQSILASTPATNLTISFLLDENTRLREDAEMLTKKLEDVSNKLDYTQMMHTSLSTLQTLVNNEAVEASNSKIDYLQMMHVTLMNLDKVWEAIK